MTLLRSALSPVARWLAPWFRLAWAFLPAGILSLASHRFSGMTSILLAWGALGSLMLTVVLWSLVRGWTQAGGVVILVAHACGAGWMIYVVPRTHGEWLVHFGQAILIGTPVAQAALYALTQTGVLLMRRARVLAEQFRRRRNWPDDLRTCRDLPEVKAFRESLVFDAAPALALLKERKPEVRLAALAALEYRKAWRMGQPETVLGVLRGDSTPEVRAAAVNALANVDDRRLVEAVADALRDPDAHVRRTAAEALFWNADRRWSWVRYGVRRALGEPVLAGDGPLLASGHKLPEEAVKDLTAWAAEKGVLGLRATQTLGVHYARSVQEQPNATLPAVLRMVQDPHTPPLLRIEVAQILCKSRDLDLRTLEALLDAGNPAPLRLLAAEALLGTGPNIRAIGSLREIAKLPNRDLSLATADVIQRRLGVDLGLAIGQPLPPPNSPRAIDVSRRLMAWAANDDSAENALDESFSTVNRAR